MNYREKEEILTKFQHKDVFSMWSSRDYNKPEQTGVVYCKGVKVGDIYSRAGKKYPVAIQGDEKIQKELDVWFPIYKDKEEARIYNDNLRAEEMRKEREAEKLKEARKAVGLE